MKGIWVVAGVGSSEPWSWSVRRGSSCGLVNRKVQVQCDGAVYQIANEAEQDRGRGQKVEERGGLV